MKPKILNILAAPHHHYMSALPPGIAGAPPVVGGVSGWDAAAGPTALLTAIDLDELTALALNSKEHGDRCEQAEAGASPSFRSTSVATWRVRIFATSIRKVQIPMFSAKPRIRR